MGMVRIEREEEETGNDFSPAFGLKKEMEPSGETKDLYNSQQSLWVQIFLSTEGALSPNSFFTIDSRNSVGL